MASKPAGLSALTPSSHCIKQGTQHHAQSSGLLLLLPLRVSRAALITHGLLLVGFGKMRLHFENLKTAQDLMR